jgi:hypothetical protein
VSFTRVSFVDLETFRWRFDAVAIVYWYHDFGLAFCIADEKAQRYFSYHFVAVLFWQLLSTLLWLIFWQLQF